MLKDLPDTLTVDEVAKVLRIGRNTAYGLIRNGHIGSLRIGKRYCIPKSALIKYMESAQYKVVL